MQAIPTTLLGLAEYFQGEALCAAERTGCDPHGDRPALRRHRVQPADPHQQRHRHHLAPCAGDLVRVLGTAKRVAAEIPTATTSAAWSAP